MSLSDYLSDCESLSDESCLDDLPDYDWSFVSDSDSGSSASGDDGPEGDEGGGDEGGDVDSDGDSDGDSEGDSEGAAGGGGRGRGRGRRGAMGGHGGGTRGKGRWAYVSYEHFVTAFLPGLSRMRLQRERHGFRLRKISTDGKGTSVLFEREPRAESGAATVLRRILGAATMRDRTREAGAARRAAVKAFVDTVTALTAKRDAARALQGFEARKKAHKDDVAQATQAGQAAYQRSLLHSGHSVMPLGADTGQQKPFAVSNIVDQTWDSSGSGYWHQIAGHVAQTHYSEKRVKTEDVRVLRGAPVGDGSVALSLANAASRACQSLRESLHGVPHAQHTVEQAVHAVEQRYTQVVNYQVEHPAPLPVQDIRPVPCVGWLLGSVTRRFPAAAGQPATAVRACTFQSSIPGTRPGGFKACVRHLHTVTRGLSAIFAHHMWAPPAESDRGTTNHRSWRWRVYVREQKGMHYLARNTLGHKGVEMARRQPGRVVLGIGHHHRAARGSPIKVSYGGAPIVKLTKFIMTFYTMVITVWEWGTTVNCSCCIRRQEAAALQGLVPEQSPEHVRRFRRRHTGKTQARMPAQPPLQA